MREKMQSVHPAGYYSISSKSCDPDTVSINSASGIFQKQPMVGNYRHSASSPHTIYEIDTATTPVNYGSAKFFKNQSLHGPQSSSSLYPLLSSRSWNLCTSNHSILLLICIHTVTMIHLLFSNSCLSISNLKILAHQQWFPLEGTTIGTHVDSNNIHKPALWRGDVIDCSFLWLLCQQRWG